MDNESEMSGFDKIAAAIKSLKKSDVTDEPVIEETVEEPVVDDAVKSEEEVETVEDVVYVTHEELELAKNEILEAVKSIFPPVDEESETIVETTEEVTDAVKSEDEVDEKDLKIKALEDELKSLKSATKSKGIPEHYPMVEKEAVKNLYIDDGRDLYGRIIKIK